MKLHMIGCSHQDTAVEFRERLSFSADQVTAALLSFRERFPSGELVLLSTCNRVELYATASDESPLDRDSFAVFLAQQQRHLSPEEVLAQMIYRDGQAAVEHLFTVAASLDSMVIGEAQILAQVKQAYERANDQGAAGPMTHSVFQAANRVAKRVQNETAIHRRRVSVPSVAVGEIVPEVFDSLERKRVVIAGAGEMAEETLRYLKQASAGNICVVNRSPEKSAELGARFDVSSAPWEALADQVREADLLIGTTSAAQPILSAADFTSLHQARGGKVMLILDLAVPRDFEAAIGEFAGVYLYQIDDLKAACRRNRRQREKEWPKAKAIISEETEAFLRGMRHRATGPVIRRLREQAQQIKSDEFERLVGKLKASNVEPAVIKEIDKSLDRMINKMLHPPLASLRDDAAEGHSRGLLDALRYLFNLGDD